MPKMLIAVALVAGMLVAVGCQDRNQPQAPRSADRSVPGQSAVADIRPAKQLPGKETITGSVTFVRQDGAVVVTADLRGFTPDSTHGFHIHESGDLSAPDLSSAGGHFNPTGHHHGAPQAQSHAGDLGNITADAQGRVRQTWRLTDITLDDGPNSIIGRSVIVHADPDDLKSQPAGNAGKRIAGGVIERAAE